MKNRTYKDLGEAIEDLRQERRISYDTIAFGIRRAQSYVYGICTRRKRLIPSYEQMQEFTEFFKIPVDFFYEYRLKKILEFVDKNREFLDHCEKESKKYKALSEAKKKTDEETDSPNGTMSAVS